MLKKLLFTTTLLCATATWAIVPAKTTALHVKQNQTFQIELVSNPTTGYSWHWEATKFEENLVTLVSHKYIASTHKKLIGAPGREIWTFKAKKGNYRVNQVGHITMTYSRPWEKNTPPAKTMTVTIVIETRGQ
ncbi:MAG: hypothetical protein A3E82_08970 [Gammaproteobacteria bacterium RIFCSPHIGHO2_12_FULL_38_11]|nr:MAG: hypothetical protein A3E82_08970 [Gammaproteobacteria bacterium RIFCSPHIGHO2_12_FULL_38_11]